MYGFVSKQIEYSIEKKIKVLKKICKLNKVSQISRLKLSLSSLTLWLLVKLNQGLPFDNRGETKQIVVFEKKGGKNFLIISKFYLRIKLKVTERNKVFLNVRKKIIPSPLPANSPPAADNRTQKIAGRSQKARHLLVTASFAGGCLGTNECIR